MKHLHRVLLLLLLLLNCALAQTSFEELVEALEAKDDNLAVKLAEELEQSEPSFGLYYSQGLAYRYQRRFAHSRAAFERALTYSPRSLTTRRRLREVKEQLSPELDELDVGSTPPYSKSEAQLLLLLPILIILGLSGTKLAGKQVERKSYLLAFGLFLLLTGVLVWNNPPEHTAVVISPTAKLLSKPSPGSSGIAVPQGALTEVIGRRSHFVEVRFGDEQTGWLREAELEVVHPR